MKSGNLISLKNVTKDYSTEDLITNILKGVNLEVKAGDFIAVTGKSGSGKSTLMNILGLLDTPTSGKYILNGIDVSSMPEDDLAYVRNKEIGFINYSEDSNGMNVDEIVMYSKYRNLGYGKIALSNFENLTNSNIVRGSQESNLGEKLMNSFQNKDYIEQWKIHGTELQKIDSSLTLEKFIELPDEEKNKLIECYGKK